MKNYDDFEHAALTDVGVRRSHNQDSQAVLLATSAKSWREQGHVFHVADGMGAHAVGELASEIATRIIAHTFHKHAHDGVPAALRKAFTEANAAIWERGQKNPEFGGMGTTSTALVLRPEGAWIGHVGDSRAYRIRNGLTQQLSFDHSLHWEKARRRHVRPEDVQDIPRNVIVRSLGPEDQVEVDIHGPHPLEEGDVFVLCSDGLSGPLSDREIGAVSSVLPPAEACEFLVDLANLRGGPDNITVIIVRIGATTPKPKKKRRSSDDDDSSGPGKPWYTRIPWPLWILLAGVLLAGAATLLTVYNIRGNDFAFLLAVLAIAAGVGCLVWYHKQQKSLQTDDEQEYRPKLKVYRETECAIDEDMVRKLARAEDVLINRAREQRWEIDWKAYQRHHQQVEQLLAQGDHAAAFRETCRAMQPFTRALRQHRQKEEAFNPLFWEKSGA